MALCVGYRTRDKPPTFMWGYLTLILALFTPPLIGEGRRLCRGEVYLNWEGLLQLEAALLQDLPPDVAP